MEVWQGEWNIGKAAKGFTVCTLKWILKTRSSLGKLSGHGCFKEYYKHFRLRDTDGNCNCRQGLEDAEHVM